MIAEFYGISRTEADLLNLCHTTLDGTTPEALTEAAIKLRLSAYLSYDNSTVLATYPNQPTIVFLGIPAPTSSLEINIHAVVITKVEDATVHYLDPTDGLEHSQEKQVFNAHWYNAFNTTIIITRN